MLFSSPFFCSVDTTSILSFRRHCVVVLFNHLLVLSRSCSFHDCPFNRSAVPSFQVLSPYQVLIQFLFFSTGVLSEFVLPCSSFLTECFQLRSSPSYSFSRNGLTSSRFFGFTHWSKKQLSFTSSLSLSLFLRCHSRSRDEILS